MYIYPIYIRSVYIYSYVVYSLDFVRVSVTCLLVPSHSAVFFFFFFFVSFTFQVTFYIARASSAARHTLSLSFSEERMKRETRKKESECVRFHYGCKYTRRCIQNLYNSGHVLLIGPPNPKAFCSRWGRKTKQNKMEWRREWDCKICAIHISHCVYWAVFLFFFSSNYSNDAHVTFRSSSSNRRRGLDRRGMSPAADTPTAFPGCCATTWRRRLTVGDL